MGRRPSLRNAFAHYHRQVSVEVEVEVEVAGTENKQVKHDQLLCS